MKKRLFIGLFLFCVVANCFAQKQIKLYEYWFDDNIAAKTNKTILLTESYFLTASIPTSNLFEGLHTFQIRFQDKSGAWSTPVVQYFIKTPVKVNRNIKQYEYWFDTNYNGKIIEPVIALDSISFVRSVRTNNLGDGLHTFQIRFQDKSGAWSSPIIQYFVKISNVLDNKIIAYRYWFNQDFTKQATVTVNPVNPLALNNFPISMPLGTIKVSTANYEFYPNITTGHKITYSGQTYFNIQFKDKVGQWSKVNVDPVNASFSINAKCDTLKSDLPIVKNLTASDTLHFYVVKAFTGDSLILNSNKSLLIDIYDPTGQKLINGSALSGINGCRFKAKQNGVYYALVRGFNSTITGTYTLNYTMIPKYSISGYNKKVVGNNAASTLVFTGNGFTNNTKISLRCGTNTINTSTLTIINNGTINAMFDFTGATVGMYDINVNFGDTTIVIKNGLEVNSQSYTVLSGNISMSTKGDYPFAGIFEYDNLELADNTNLLSFGISQLVIKVKHTLTIGKNVTIRVRNGYYSGAPSHSTTAVTKDNISSFSNYKGDGYSLYPSTFGLGGNGGKGGNGGYGDYQVRDIAYNVPMDFPGLGGGGGGGGAGGYGGGIGGAPGSGGGHSETIKSGKGYNGTIGMYGNNNGNAGGSGGPGGYFTQYIYSNGGAGGGSTSVGTTTAYAGGNNANGGGGGGGNGANGTQGGARMLGDYYSMYNGDGGGGGGAGGYGGGVLVVTANKIEYDSLSIPSFIALGQNGGYGGSGGQGSTSGTNASNGSNGTNGESGLIIINTPNQIPQFTYIANRLGSNTSPLPGGHGIVSGIATVLYNVDNLNTVIKNICDDNINNFALYPNPTTDFFKISGVKSTAIVKLYNLEGREVLSKEITNDEFIQINFLSKGLYMVKVFSQDGIQVMKVMKN